MLISECHVGDKVRAIDNDCYAITNHGWTGYIRSVTDCFIRVSAHPNDLEAFPVAPQYFELVCPASEIKPEPVSVLNPRDVITEEEHSYILNRMEDLLEEYGYRYSVNALNKIINTWATNKADLIAAFKKHPNYLEGKFMIAFQSDFERTADRKKCIDFSSWLCAYSQVEFIKNIIPGEIKSRKEEPEITLPWSIFNFLRYDLGNLTTQFIDEDTVNKLNKILPEIHAHTGQKTSRVINKMCCYLGYDKCPDYNREFAKYADGLNPLVIKRHTVLSLNPLDYLTMSFGNSWASCHTIDKLNKRSMPNNYSGCYSSGTISYMLDKTSMVFYTVDASYNGTEYWNEPKINRQMFHWGEEKLIQGRLYPQDNDCDYEAYKPYRNIVQEIISTIYDFPNLWDVKKGTYEASNYIYSEGTHYRDYESYSNCNISRVRGSENNKYITVGHDPICIECGHEHDYAECINCCTTPGLHCAGCGDEIDEEDAHWVDGEPYCLDCVSYCECCELYTREETTWIPSQCRYVCDSCLSEYYSCCSECDEYYYNEDMIYISSEGIDVCPRCLADDFIQCDDCGEWFRNTNVLEYEPTGECLCQDCYDSRLQISDDEAC